MIFTETLREDQKKKLKDFRKILRSGQTHKSLTVWFFTKFPPNYLEFAGSTDHALAAHNRCAGRYLDTPATTHAKLIA